MNDVIGVALITGLVLLFTLHVYFQLRANLRNQSKKDNDHAKDPSQD